MALPRLILPPNQSSYSIVDGVEVSYAQLDGGAPRIRKSISGSVSRARVSWSVDPNGYRYLRAFYHATQHGALPFLVDLVLDESTLTTYECNFVPGTFGLATLLGQEHTVVCELTITPVVPVDYDYETSAVEVVDSYGTYMMEDLPFDLLALLVNTTLPVSLPG